VKKKVSKGVKVKYSKLVQKKKNKSEEKRKYKGTICVEEQYKVSFLARALTSPTREVREMYDDVEEEEVPAGLRVVSLLPSATEIIGVLGLAERLVGVTHECDCCPDEEGLEAAPAKGIAQKEAMCSKKALCVDTFALCGYLCAMCL
jgi:hypothetical protein